jgi:hypothetical protein
MRRLHVIGDHRLRLNTFAVFSMNDKLLLAYSLNTIKFFPRILQLRENSVNMQKEF